MLYYCSCIYSVTCTGPTNDNNSLMGQVTIVKSFEDVCGFLYIQEAEMIETTSLVIHFRFRFSVTMLCNMHRNDVHRIPNEQAVLKRLSREFSNYVLHVLEFRMFSTLNAHELLIVCDIILQLCFQ